MVEANKSVLKFLWRIVVQSRENYGQNCREILLDGRPRYNLAPSVKAIFYDVTYTSQDVTTASRTSNP